MKNVDWFAQAVLTAMFLGLVWAAGCVRESAVPRTSTANSAPNADQVSQAQTTPEISNLVQLSVLAINATGGTGTKAVSSGSPSDGFKVVFTAVNPSPQDCNPSSGSSASSSTSSTSSTSTNNESVSSTPVAVANTAGNIELLAGDDAEADITFFHLQDIQPSSTGLHFPSGKNSQGIEAIGSVELLFTGLSGRPQSIDVVTELPDNGGTASLVGQVTRTTEGFAVTLNSNACPPPSNGYGN